jgi:DNA-directed RNA polymerase specialized sigma24 family protein
MLLASPPPPLRSRETLERQMQALRAALRAAYADDPDQYASLSLAQTPWGELRGPRPRATAARYTLAVHALVDALPRHVVVSLPAAVRRLPPEERLAVQLVLIAGHGQAASAAALGCCSKTLGRRLASALEKLARLLWTDHGEPRYLDAPAAPTGGRRKEPLP